MRQLTDHHNGRIAAAQRHEVAAADFTLDREAELFEEAFDGQVKRGFQRQLQCRVCDSVTEFNSNRRREFLETEPALRS